jgi:hypothetical protein
MMPNKPMLPDNNLYPMGITCPQCHTVVQPADFFCPTCGKKLKDKPLSTTPLTEIMYYIGSVVLAPLGIWWGIKYLKQPGGACKRIGTVSIILTVLSLVISSILITLYLHSMSGVMNTQLNTLQGL